VPVIRRHLGDAYELIASEQPDRTAVVFGLSRLTYEQLDRLANGLAATLVEAGLGQQSKVALYLDSRPEFLVTYAAAFKASLVPCSVNYRYKGREVRYILENSDAEAVVFGSSFANTLAALREDLPLIRTWVCVDDGAGAIPDWAVPWVDAAAPRPDLAVPWSRDADDLLFVYTGGTTGRPKAVMWRQRDYMSIIGAYRMQRPHPHTAEEYRARLATDPVEVVVPASPLMHGMGLVHALEGLHMGGRVVLLPSAQRFSAEELLDWSVREGATRWAIVGDPFARPTLELLDEAPGRWDLRSLRAIASSGAMLSEPVKTGLLRHLPRATIHDLLSSTEAIGMGIAISAGAEADPPDELAGAGGEGATARFVANPHTTVLGPDGTPVTPGSGEIGIAAVEGLLPVGYYRDPQKSAEILVDVAGRRVALSGDQARVEADGTVVFLGRGSACINTGGEKVFPEEVEEVLKELPGVRDAACVGVPHPRWGEAVVAIVDAATSIEEPAAIAFAKDRLAGYKAPKRVLLGPSFRGPAGKIDYAEARAFATEAVGAWAR
jgi:acyl-CoA synthetase (AMP-forming)/AMP-acid ligase II